MINEIKQLSSLKGTLLIALALASAQAAAANRHYLCYQSKNYQGNLGNNPTAIVACRAEPGGYCEIDGPYGTRPIDPGDNILSISDTAKRYYYPQSSGQLVSEIRFFSPGSSTPETLHCSVSARAGGTATAEASIEGYTADESGYISTGVWKKTLHGVHGRTGQTLSVPGDFVVVGGGAEGTDQTPGALLYKSTYNTSPLDSTGIKQHRSWETGINVNGQDMTYENTAYVIGMKIYGMSAADLRGFGLPTDPYYIEPKIAFEGSTTCSESKTSQVAWPSTSLTCPGKVVIGGGAGALGSYPNSYGQYLTSSFPEAAWIYSDWPQPPDFIAQFYGEPNGWRASSKDHMISSPGSVAIDVLSIQDYLYIDNRWYRVKTAFFGLDSVSANHPSVVVAGEPGNYALTGVGASVDYGSGWGNLLWKLKPRPDVAGAEVASKDHWLFSPAKITGYALGIKLE